MNALIPNKDIFINRSLMIEDAISPANDTVRDGVIIGGNLCSWYNGFDSFIVAMEFGSRIFAPSMGRMKEGETRLDGLTHIEYKTWIDWMATLSTMKYAVHLMPIAAAGTFALNCSILGIPCIGNEDIDTQKICHPELSVNLYGGVGRAKELAIKLKDDKEFYMQCSEQTKAIYKKEYTEEIWKRNFNKFLETMCDKPNEEKIK